MTAPAASAPSLRTPSLRRRVTLVVLGVLAAMLLVLSVLTDLVLADRLDAQLRQRLLDRAGVATALVDQVSSRDLARRLEGEGVSVVLTTRDGEVYAEGPLGGGATAGAQAPSEPPASPGSSPAPQPQARPSPPRPTGSVQTSGDLYTVTTRLSDGSRLELLADAGDVASTLDQVRWVLGLGALAVLFIAAVIVPWVVALAIRPLDGITDLARTITGGDRLQRLHPDRPQTELGRTAAAFDVMLDELVGAERRALESEARLRVFLSDAAHELRTPLTGAQAAAEHVLRDDPPADQRDQALVGLVRQTRRAGRLVDDMLLMARIDRGVELDRRPGDLRETARLALEPRRLLHPGVTMELTGPTAPARFDPDRMEQVIGNLLDNAVRAAGPTGHVTVTSWADAGGAGLDVRDDGPGVPADDAERIFERLVRLDAGRARHDGGAGLGLSIARGLARAHGGDLRLLGPGPGARFRVELPA